MFNYDGVLGKYNSWINVKLINFKMVKLFSKNLDALTNHEHAIRAIEVKISEVTWH